VPILPAFIIGLREGVEASLIVGIIAAFLVGAGRRDRLAAMWAGVGTAVALCLAVGLALEVVNRDLPQRQQEAFETVVALVATAMVTYMVVWMRRHARGLRAALERQAAGALAAGSAALVAMAAFAVLREGFETSVFLLAAFERAASPALAGTGAVLGMVVAGVIGYLVYRGGARLNLSRFFRITGFVLVIVAAGLLASAAHSAHEPGGSTAFRARRWTCRGSSSGAR
jgi:high-affinity iron transporter